MICSNIVSRPKSIDFIIFLRQKCFDSIRGGHNLEFGYPDFRQQGRILNLKNSFITDTCLLKLINSLSNLTLSNLS